MSIFYRLATGALRILSPEDAHQAGLLGLRLGLGPQQSQADDPRLQVRVAGLDLPNPVGLAAGFDKNAEAPDALLRAGFGFVECGAVTPRPQAGNAKPRVFRLTEDRAVINRMGFNNAGLDAFRARLDARKHRAGIVGVNLGANKDSTDRAEDYAIALAQLDGLAGFFTINISSPNTPGLRNLQSADALDDLLGRVAEVRLAQAVGKAPTFLKVAPDIEEAEIDRMVAAVRTYQLDGIIVSNTTLARPESLQNIHAGEAGGLSGRPLFERSTHMLKFFRQAAGPDLPLIGVGGIENAETAWAKIRAGANAIQLYSALVYAGPGLVQDIKAGLLERLQAEGFGSISEAVGTG
jgi:dihydroorotate dehydrogenase